MPPTFHQRGNKAPPDMQGVRTALGTHQKYQMNPFNAETCNVNVLAGQLDRFHYRLIKIRYRSVQRVQCRFKRSRRRFLTVKNGKLSREYNKHAYQIQSDEAIGTA